VIGATQYHRDKIISIEAKVPHYFFDAVLACPLIYQIVAMIFYESSKTIGDMLVKSLILKRSVAIDGHITSVSLEDAFWDTLKEIAVAHDETLSNIVTGIDKTRQRGSNLSSAIRLFVLDWMRSRNKRLPELRKIRNRRNQPPRLKSLIA
jgi:predicted DNA-binding ribbon-helix-helix protein